MLAINDVLRSIQYDKFTCENRRRHIIDVFVNKTALGDYHLVVLRCNFIYLFRRIYRRIYTLHINKYACNLPDNKITQ